MDSSLEGTKSYRSYAPGRSTSYGRNSMGDEPLDSSINFAEEVEFGDMDYPPRRASKANNNKSLVDIFLAEDAAAATAATDEFHPVPMQQTQNGSQVKKWILYVCLAVVFIVIFVTAPKPGFGMSGTNDNEDEGTAPTNAPTELSQSTTAPTLKPTPSTTQNEQDNTSPQELSHEASEPIAQPKEELLTEGTHLDMTRPQAVHAFLLKTKMSAAEDLNDDRMPSAEAMNWIAMDDPAELDIPGYPYNKHNVGTPEEQEVRFLQRYALACLYFSMEAEYFGESRRQLALEDEDENRYQFDDHWTVEDDVCDWFGVTCNDDKYVMALNLKHTKLNGRLVPELFHEAALPQLTSLDLSHNSIKGPFPTLSVVNHKLEALLLEHNHIEGRFEPILQQFPGLVELSLQANQLSGSLPKDWSQVSNLKSLKLANNDLTGSLSPGIGALTNLEWCDLDDNQLKGSIPTDYAALIHLRSLKLANNQIDGTLPEFLGDIHLINLSLQNNPLHGEVPASLGKLSILEHLHLENTNLVGTMPSEVCDLMGRPNGLKTLSADCKEPELECGCCTVCY